MFLSGSQSLRALRSACRIACVLFSMLAVAPVAAAQGLEPGGSADMGQIAIGSSSLDYTFTFTATAATTIGSITLYEEGKPNADFVQTPGVTTTCTGTIQTNHSCTIYVTFSPQKVGFRRGAIVITDNTGSVVFTQFLYGVGLGPQISFAPTPATTLSSLTGVTPTTFKPSSAVYDGAGNLYFFDYQNGRLLERDAGGTISSLGNFSGNAQSALAINGAGTLYLTLPTGIAVVTPATGAFTMLATPGVTITTPGGITIDGAGFIFVSDSQNNRIASIPPDGSTASYVATTGVTLSDPKGLAIDYKNLYIVDSGNGRIVTVSVATGVAAGLTSNGSINAPQGVAVDASGTLVVTLPGSAALNQVSPAGAVSPLAADATVTIASEPESVLVTTSGDFVSSDSTLGLVFLTRNSNAQLIFKTPTPQNTTDGTDGYLTVRLLNSGNEIIQLASTSPTISKADFFIGATNTCPINQTTSTPLAIAGSCTYTYGFKPSIIGTDSGVLSIRGTAEGTGTSTAGTGILVTNTDTLTGTGISPVTSFTVVATPNATTPGAPVGFTITALEGTATLTTFTGTVMFTMTDPIGMFLGGTSYTFTAADKGTHTFTAALGAEFNSAGAFTITLTYGSITATSNVVTVLYASQTQLTSSHNPTAIGGQTTLTATVSGVGTATFPMGTVTFYDGSTVIGTRTPVGGQCSITPPLAVGSNQTLKAIYGGSTSFSPSTSNTINQTVAGYTATFVLSSNLNPSVAGQQVTFTATVTPTAGQAGATTPSGSVTIKSGGTTICSPTLSAGSASCNMTYGTPGNYAITATYTGDAFYPAATSNSVTQVVNNKATPKLTLTSSLNPSVVNQSVTFTATMAPPTGSTTVPTGTVNFTSGGTTICTNVLINAGIATCSFTYATANSYPIIATYSGNTIYLTAMGTLTQVVNNKTTPKITLTGTPNPATPNQAITYTATMAPPTGSTTVPTGTVTFTSNGTTLCATVNLSGGLATCAHTYTATGSYPILATYNGSAIYNTVASTTLTEQVLYNSTTTMSASPNSAAKGATVTLSATVVATPGQTGAGQPAGMVTFKNGATTIGTCTLTGTSCSTTTTFASGGAQTLTAVYGGSTSFKTSTSTNYTETITAYTATASMTSSVNPSTLNQQTMLTVTVVAANGQTAPPALMGTVNFYDGGTTLLGSCTLASGVCNITTSFTSQGPHILTAKYLGDTDYASVTSPTYTQNVNTLFSAQVALNATPNPVAINTPATLTANVTATPGQAGAGTPAGTVKFYDGATLLGSCTLVNGTCNITPSFTTSGTHSITATYTGSVAFNPANTTLATTESVTGYATTVQLGSSINPSAVNQQTLLTATVGIAAGQTTTSTPTGTVNFYDGATLIGSCTLNPSSCTLPASFSTATTHSLTAVYLGDNHFSTQTSLAYPQVVSNYLATVALSASPNPVFINNTVTLSAAVTSTVNVGPAPSGKVTFLSGTTPLGSAVIVNGVATLSTTFPAVNTYSITAVYGGDTNFTTVTSTAASEVVEDFTFALTTPTGGSATVLGGHAATYTYTVTPVGGTVLPSNVSFTLAGFPSNSVYSFSPATLAAGSGTATITLTITPPSVAQLEKPVLPPNHRGRELPITLALLLLPFGLRFRGKRGRRPAALLLWLMMMAGALGLTGCLSDANSGYYGSTPQTYSLSATASSGSLSHSANATLVRQ